MQDLSKLIPARSGYQIYDATAINDNGQILANACNATGQLRAPAADPQADKPAHNAG